MGPETTNLGTGSSGPDPSLTSFIDAYWDDDTDEADDFSIRAGADEYGWLRLDIDGRTLCLRPSTVLSLIGGRLP